MTIRNLPPKLFLHFFRWYCHPKLRDHIEGDLLETHNEQVTALGKRKADVKFIVDVLLLFRPGIIKPAEGYKNLNNYGMIKNNLKMSMRVFKRNKSYTFINVLGLSSGLAIAMLIFSYVQFEMSYEKGNPLANRLVRVSMDYFNGETVIGQDAGTYHPLGPRMNSEFSEVVNFARAYRIHEATLRIGNNFIRETEIYAVDSSFFKLFNYPLQYRSSDNTFSTPFEAVLTESQAIKCFGRTDVVGESLSISDFNGNFKITGVVKDSPLNTHLKIHLLISYPSIQSKIDKGWSNNDTYTYLLLADQSQYEGFENNLATFNDLLHKENRILGERIIAQPFKDIHLYSQKPYELEQNGDAKTVFFLFGVAILVIIIAIVNYINLSTSKSLDRAKEVGIRKVIGSSIGQLRIQFFTESFLINLLAALVGLTIMVVSLPAFINMAGLPSGFNFWNNSLFWYTIISVIIVSTILSGAFPSLILSSFQPIKVLKGKFTHSATGITLRKALVIFQFSITVFLLIQTFTAKKQLAFMQQKDLGLDVNHTIVVRSPDGTRNNEAYQEFKTKLLGYSQFQSVALSNSVPGLPYGEMGQTNGQINLVDVAQEQSFNFYIYFSDADFLSTMLIELKAGQNFKAETKNQDEILVNEEATKLWGIADPALAVGKKINLWGRQPTIIGVVKNFSQVSAKSAYVPMIFLHREGNNKLASIRTRSGNTKNSLALIKQIYASVFPNSPFDYFFLDQEFDKQYRSDEQFQNVFTTLTAFAIIIACLGLFGLVSFTVANRTKEIGVRKVLGANVTQMVLLLSKDFMSLIMIAIIISVSVTYFIIQGWLENFAFRIDLNAWLFVIPAAGVLLVALFTIFIKTLQASSVNPVNSLRDE